MWQVIVIEIETMQTVEAFKPVDDLSKAESMKRGVEINMNKDKYMTELVYLGEVF